MADLPLRNSDNRHGHDLDRGQGHTIPAPLPRSERTVVIGHEIEVVLATTVPQPLMIVRNVAVALAIVTDGTSAVDHVVVIVQVAIILVAIDMAAETVVITIAIVSDDGNDRDHEIVAILDQSAVVVIATIVVGVRLDRPENWWTTSNRTKVSSENYKRIYCAPDWG